MQSEVKSFFERQEYRRFRYWAIQSAQNRCQLCGNSGDSLKVVYSKALEIFPEFALNRGNSRVICTRCYLEKWDGGDYGGFKSFYDRPEWHRLRGIVLKREGIVCKHCNRVPQNPSEVHIDHTKPKYIFPELALTISNLRPLCKDCNLGKGAQLFHERRVRSLLEEHLERERTRAAIFEKRYRLQVLRHISQGPNLDTLVDYIRTHHSLQEAISDPHLLRRIVEKNEKNLMLLQTRPGETFMFNLA